MIKLLVLLFACLALTSAERSSRIRHGRVVSQGELDNSFSFVVSVTVCGNGRLCSACTGSLISANTVLLSSHCFCGVVGQAAVSVYFKTLTAGKGRKVSGRSGKRMPFRCNDKNSYQANNDIATITLAQPVRDISPVQLECGSVRTGQQVTMIGYGLDERGQGGTLRIGRRATKQCSASFTDAVCVDGSDMSATSTDEGDSGGPLLIPRGGSGYAQVGVTHGRVTMQFMAGRRRWTETTVLWTRVGAHCGWIRS